MDLKKYGYYCDMLYHKYPRRYASADMTFALCNAYNSFSHPSLSLSPSLLVLLHFFRPKLLYKTSQTFVIYTLSIQPLENENVLLEGNKQHPLVSNFPRSPLQLDER